jgi:hypothetical protein
MLDEKELIIGNGQQAENVIKSDTEEKNGSQKKQQKRH